MKNSYHLSPSVLTFNVTFISRTPYNVIVFIYFKDGSFKILLILLCNPQCVYFSY